MMRYVVSLILVVSFTFTACQSEEAKPEPSLAEKLAVIDGESRSAAPQYDRLLSSLDQKCEEGQVDISDQAVRGTQIIHEQAGKSVKAREMLQAMDESIPSGMAGMRCVEVAAAVVTLLSR